MREVIGCEERYRYLLHDRDSIFATDPDTAISSLGLTALKSPPDSPKANAICERVIGIVRRECLDWMIPLSESHLRWILKSCLVHYNHGRPHMSLGPGIPNPPPNLATEKKNRHHLSDRLVVRAGSVLSGLHHEYSVVPIAS